MQDRRDLIAVVPPDRTDVATPFEPKLPPPALEPYAGYRNPTEAEESVRFAEYWRAIRKRLWLVIGVTVLGMTLTAIYMSRRPDEYRAMSQVQVDFEQDNSKLVSSDRRAPVVNNDPAYFNTQLQRLDSASLLRRVIKEINLDKNPDFQTNKTDESRSSLRSLLRVVGLAGDKKKTSDTGSVPVATSSEVANGEDVAEAKRLQPFVETLQKNLAIEPVREARSAFRDTRLINIAYNNTNPELAALIVNTIADVFTKSNNERRTGTNSKTNTYLRDRVAELQSDVKRDEEQLARLKQQGGILQLDEGKTLALSQLQALNEQLLKAQETRKSAEAAFRAASQPGALDALTQDGTARRYVDDTKFEIAKLEQEKSKLSEEYTDLAPEVKELDKAITSRRKALEDFQKNAQVATLQNLKTRYEAALQQEQKIQTSFDTAKNQAQVQSNSGINIKLLEQRLTTNQETLSNLQKTSRENDITAAGTENNISISNVAIPPDQPIGPHRLTNVLIAGFLAGLFGCGLALFLEYLDDSVKTTEDVENILRLPALAVIPTIENRPRRRLLVAGTESDETGLAARTELLISNDSRSALAEAYRQLRTSVLLSTAGHAPKSLLITSSVPSEGKTTTAVNTAISLAQTGAKVLIIDADMRRPRLHSIFNISNKHGLSSILSSKMSDAEILDIIQSDLATNLHLLPSGAVPPNPAELIGSEQMHTLLRTLEKHFTHVVVDSPPIASFTDGVLIATMVDGVLLVVHSGKSSRQIVKRARQLLADVNAKIFGVVLNNVKARSHDNQYYYQSYYNSYYGDNE